MCFHVDAQDPFAYIHLWLSRYGISSVSGLQHCNTLQLNVYAGRSAPESSRVLTAVLERLDERLHTIELGVKLSTHQTKVFGTPLAGPAMSQDQTTKSSSLH